jgi:hypothetical protein
MSLAKRSDAETITPRPAMAQMRLPSMSTAQMGTKIRMARLR